MTLIQSSDGAHAVLEAVVRAVVGATSSHTFDFQDTTAAVLAGVRSVALASCPWLSSEQVEQVHSITLGIMKEFTGGDLLEYELQPQAGGTSMWWPDASLYSKVRPPCARPVVVWTACL